MLGKLDAFPSYHSVFLAPLTSYKGVFPRLDGDGQILSLIFPPVVLSEIYNATNEFQTFLNLIHRQ